MHDAQYFFLAASGSALPSDLGRISSPKDEFNLMVRLFSPNEDNPSVLVEPRVVPAAGKVASVRGDDRERPNIATGLRPRF